MSRSGVEGKSFAFTTGAYGNRPTFLLTRERVDDRHQITLYELAPEDIATARQARFNRSQKTVHIPIRSLGDAIVDGETPADIASDDESVGYDWDGWCAIKIATLRGVAFNEVSYLIEPTLKEAGKNAEVVCTGNPATVELPEGAGVRLSIAFRALKPLSRRDRMRAIADGIRQMSLGECYYWHAKARSPSSPNGVKALRTLLADHI
ncbi:DUF7680 family protein [Haloferax prahovense]|uniref:DUF7680 family protein n=1 Tax=Haloferax prahovense TaxID=381852 RepID=UPI0009FC52D3|nr:hypothetical protein [Haloferax prahovense]